MFNNSVYVFSSASIVPCLRNSSMSLSFEFQTITKQEGGFPTPSSNMLIILFALQRRQPSHQLFSSYLLLRFGYRKHLRFRLLGTSPMNLHPNHQK